MTITPRVGQVLRIRDGSSSPFAGYVDTAVTSVYYDGFAYAVSLAPQSNSYPGGSPALLTVAVGDPWPPLPGPVPGTGLTDPLVYELLVP